MPPSQARLKFGMDTQKLNEALAKLTKLQRLVLLTLDSSYEDFLCVKQVLKAVDKTLSEKTIRRAIKRLFEMGLIDRIPGTKKGRGYTTIFKMKEED